MLDEPLGKLDSLTRITMQAELVSLWQRAGFTTLLVTHDAEEALFLANRVIVLSDRPARIKADIWSTGPIRAIAAIPISRTCASRFSACLDWTPHGDTTSQSAAREPQRQNESDHVARAAQLAAHSRSGRLSTTATAVFRSRISSTCRRPGLLGPDRPGRAGRRRRRRCGSGAHSRRHRQGRSLDRARPVDALHPAPRDGAQLALARPPVPETGPGDGRRRRPGQRASCRAGARIAGARRIARHDRPAHRNRVAAERPKDLFDRRADPEMVRGLGQDRRSRNARRIVSGSGGPSGNADRGDLGPSRPARQRQP